MFFLGHSRTIVGIEEGTNGNYNLIIFDPGTRRNQIEKSRQTSFKTMTFFRRSISVFNKMSQNQAFCVYFGSFQTHILRKKL